MSCSKEVATEKQLDKYVRQNYGRATLIQSERTDTSLICYFEDSEYLFQYWVKSRVADFNMDGSSFFKYEAKSSNFEKQYCNALYLHIRDSLYMLEETYSVSINVGKYDELLDIIFQNTDEKYMLAVCSEIGRLYIKADSRNYLRQEYIKIYSNNNTYLGKYKIYTDQYITFAEEELSRFKLLAKSKDSNAKYQYLKTISLQEFAEMTQISIEKFEPQSESSVTLYYFSTDKGVTFFIANVLYNGECYSDYYE